MTDLVLGCAVKLPAFDTLADWLRARDRAIEVQDFVDHRSLTTGRDALLDAWRTRLDGYGGPLGMHGPFLGLDLANPDPELRALVSQRILQGLEVAEDLGATMMVLHSPFTLWHRLNRQNFPHIRPVMMDAAAECLAPAIARAADIGCTLVLENTDDADPQDRADLARQIGAPNLKVSVDTGHAALAHGQYGAPPVTDFLTQAGDLLAHVHLQDADGYADRHWHPGEGTLPWPAIFQAIRDAGTQPRLILEVMARHADLPASVARLSSCGVV